MPRLPFRRSPQAGRQSLSALLVRLLPPLALCLLAPALQAQPSSGNGIMAASFHMQDADRGVGDVLQFAIPLAGLGAAAYQHDWEGARELGYTLLGAGLTTEVLKSSLNGTSWGRRPDGGDYSFPSGHTTNACAGAAFIGRRYGWEYGGAAMVPAAFVGWSRVDEGVHHWRDVIAGCAIGVGFSYLFVKPEESRFTITPDISRDGFGLSFNMQY